MATPGPAQSVQEVTHRPCAPCQTSSMGLHLLVFIGVAAIVIVIPGPDTAVVTKNVLIHGRRAGLGTSLGVSAGLSIWTIAAAVGVASLVRASEVAFTVLKLAGALYLVWLGIQALRAAGRELAEDRPPRPAGRPVMGVRGGFRQGVLSDLANPKIGIFFTSLLPQFVSAGHAVLLPVPHPGGDLRRHDRRSGCWPTRWWPHAPRRRSCARASGRRWTASPGSCSSGWACVWPSSGGSPTTDRATRRPSPGDAGRGLAGPGV